MLFNSLEFAFFFPIVAAIYFLLPQRLRTPHLLVSSCVFYMAFIPAYIFILVVTILIDYVAGIYLERTVGRRRTWLLALSITATCAVLFVFKYFHFFTNNFIGMAGFFGWKLSGPSINIILPIGLSFHTFQSLSYVVEVYRGRQRAETNFVTYATYVMFFPQLVAGPIERPQHLLHQFHEFHRFDYARVTSGMRRMAWGFFKKLVVADRLALYVNDVYVAPQSHNGLQLTIATIFFAYQIYCDFSGYSDIAVGSARVLGFKLIDNFNRPYASQSIAEFWKRWHISLSTWFRDYVYIPLGGNRVTRFRHYVNLFVTFGVSGFWHGANWTYVFWGLLNGVYLIFGDATKSVRQRTWEIAGPRVISFVRPWVMLFSTFALTCFGWILFRARNVDDASYICTHLFINWDFRTISTGQFLLRQMPVALAAIAFLEIVQYLQARVSLTAAISRLATPFRWAIYASSVMGVILFGVFQKAQFIYFQF
jgi:alginate O-acetyltransferase complex protein AlgI